MNPYMRCFPEKKCREGAMEDKHLAVLLKQYEVLFDYSTKQAPATKNAILAFGLSAIGTILAATIALLNYGASAVTGKELCLVSFFFVIPAACICLLFIWIGEIHRMLRAGHFVRGIEEYLNAECGQELLAWERYIREKGNRIIYPDLFVISIFLGTTVVSIICGLSVLGCKLNLTKLDTGYVIAYFAGLCFFVGGWLVFLSKKIRSYS
jgi:hypothetical protein